MCGAGRQSKVEVKDNSKKLKVCLQCGTSVTMPPKATSKKPGKVKPSAVVDALSTDEMSKDQLEEHIVRLREELDREQEERSYFQLERDKIHSFWEISKRTLEEVQVQLRNRRREREEAKERHRVEITDYKQKLKRVLCEQHCVTSGLKMDAVASASLTRQRHVEAELTLRREKHSLQAALREKKLHNQTCIQELQLKHQVELMELANRYDRRVRELEADHQQRAQSLVEAEDRRRRAEIDQLEDMMRRRAGALLEDHSRALRDAEEFYSSLQTRLLGEQRELKDELAAAARQQAVADRDLSAGRRENRRLSRSLQESRQSLEELHRQREKQAAAKRAAARGRVTVTEGELRDLTVKQELLLQACEKVRRERDELLRRQTDAVLDVQRRSGLKQLVLERKMAALTEAVQKKEAQLCAALSASNVEQPAARHAESRLRDILESKQAAVDALQSELARDCQEYDELLQTCKEELKARGVPLHDFPFKPSQNAELRPQAF